jgi:serine phosphatase RsbU (regulator of sigma subunit)
LFFSIYPERRKIKFIYPVLLSIPGLAAAVIFSVTDLLITFYGDAPGSGNIIASITFIGAAAFYGTASVLMIIYRSFKPVYFVIRRDLLYLGAGTAFMFSMIGLFTLPDLFPDWIYRSAVYASAASFIYLLFVSDYIIKDMTRLDIKRFYVNVIYRTAIFILLFIPVYYFLDFSSSSDYKNTLLTVSPVIIFTYMFLFRKYIKPILENMVWKGYRNLTQRFSESLPSFDNLPKEVIEQSGSFWEFFYTTTIDEFFKKFDITAGTLFILDEESNSYKTAHYTGKNTDVDIIRHDDPLIKSLSLNKDILHKRKILFDPDFQEHSDYLLSFMRRNSAEVILPLMDNHQIMIGFLLLSRLEGSKAYSDTFLSALELYRIQFQYQLSNGLFLERVRKEEIRRHDKMSVNMIKSKVIPAELEMIPGLRVSSFYINNSDNGGDFFDSIKLSQSKLLITAGDASYYGIESSLIYLQLYSIVRVRASHFSSPSFFLNYANRILTEQNMTARNIPFMAAVYSSKEKELEYASAGYNPLIIFDPKSGSFMEYEQRSVPLAVNTSQEYISEKISFPKGCIGIIGSDGYYSAVDNNGSLYQSDWMKKIIEENKYDTPAVIARLLYRDYKNFTGEFRQVNDATLIVFKAE